MNRIAALLFILNLFTFSFTYSQSVEEIIKKYTDKMGNSEFKKNSTFIISGITKDSTHQIDFNILFKRPNKIRFEFDNKKLKSEAIIIYDGIDGWAIFPNTKYPNLLYSEITDSIKSIISDFDDRLSNYEERDYNVLLLPQDTYEGKKVHVIKLIKPFGNEYKYFLNTETLLPIKIETKEKHKHDWSKSTIYQSDYKDFSGFLYPTKSITNSKNKNITTIITSIEVSKDLQDSLFILPGMKPGKARIFPLTKLIWKKIKRNK